jgi:uncharacterized DUF497 family protein
MELTAGIVSASPPGFDRPNPDRVVSGQCDQGDREPRRSLVGEEVSLRLAEGQFLVVVYTERGDSIGIIGARRATRREWKDYEKGS